VWVDEEKYAHFDPDQLTVKIPESTADVRIKVRIEPVS
jgi:hypothetical protein